MEVVSFKEKLMGCKIKTSDLAQKKFLVTGATGLIGKVFATKVLKLSVTEHLFIKVYLLVRNKTKLSAYLLDQERLGNVSIIESDICDFIDNFPAVDYIVHCASITDSKMMVDHPIELIKTNVCGTLNMLENAKNVGVKSFIYLSSMEAYGFSQEEILLNEEKMQYLNPLEIRSCYPESKRMCENICISYAAEYGVPTRILRLAQTFGAGVARDDKRVFAEFARCVLQKKNIKLLTAGTSCRMYLDVEDAVIAILSVLLNGENGIAYNVANQKTYCSIMQMASLVAEEIGKGKIKVEKVMNENTEFFSPTHKFYLDTSRIEMLGWKPYTDLAGMYNNMIADWEFATQK